MATTERKDVWASGDAYEPYVGRWSRLVARDFVDWLGVAGGRRWLDVGCGTGALCQTILERAAPQSLLGIDPSDGFIAHARRAIGDTRAEFRVGDAQSLPIDDRTFDAVVSGLVINFVPDTPKAMAEMARVTRPGGTVAAYVWDYAGEMQMMRRFWDAAVALDPAALAKDEGRRFPSAGRNPSPLCSTAPGLRMWRCGRSTYRPSSRTSTTIGRRSSAARRRHRATACRCRRMAALRCESGFAGRSPSGATAAST